MLVPGPEIGMVDYTMWYGQETFPSKEELVGDVLLRARGSTFSLKTPESARERESERSEREKDAQRE